MARPTNEVKACPRCGKPRIRLYKREYWYDGEYQKRPFGWICYGNHPDKRHEVEIELDDRTGVYRWQTQ